MRTFALALTATLIWTGEPTAEEAWRTGWPNLGGPTGNLLPLRSPTPLVDDLAQARLAWISADASLGSAKTGSRSFASAESIEQRIGPEARVHPGNWANVVVADGRVFAAGFVPSGEVFTAPFTPQPGKDGIAPAAVPVRFRVEAEDTVVCYDAATGAVAWRAREPGGVILSGGKRGGFQVAPALDGGRIFALGSTGRLTAYEAASGARLWQTGIDGLHAACERQRQQDLATARSGRLVVPDGPAWFTSLVAADGVVVAADFDGRGDHGLRGYAAADGRELWRVADCLSRYATPSLLRLDGQAFLMCGSAAGTLRLLRLQDGAEAWRLDGLGQQWTTLAPGGRTVMVNVKPTVGKAATGLWGAVRFDARQARIAWSMPDEPANVHAIWLDTGARQFAFVRDGRVLLHTEGRSKQGVAGRVLLLDEETGAVLAEAPNGPRLTGLRETILWLGDRALVREDSSHGAGHGGRHPLMLWDTVPGKLAPRRDEGRLGGLDLIDFETAYEVMMHLPLVDGRIFERTDDGRLACYDLRRRPGTRTLALALPGAQPGMPPQELRLWLDGDAVAGGKAWIPDQEQAGLPFGRQRREALWQRIDPGDLRLAEGRLAGTLRIDAVTHRWPLQLDLRLADATATGSWRRTVAALPRQAQASGRIQGRAGSERAYPTPWLQQTPWTSFGANPPGTETWVLQLEGAITVQDGAVKGLTICLDHDGTGFTRGAGAAFSFRQAWHDVDPARLAVADGRLAGTMTVLLNPDAWVDVNQGGPVAGSIAVDVQRQADGSLQGTYTATWGVAWEATGSAVGATR